MLLLNWLGLIFRLAAIGVLLQCRVVDRLVLLLLPHLPDKYAQNSKQSGSKGCANTSPDGHNFRVVAGGPVCTRSGRRNCYRRCRSGTFGSRLASA